MTVSIFDALSILPSGTRSAKLTPEELSRYLADYYGTDREKERNAHHMLRDELYRDGGVSYMRSFVDSVFADPLVRALRQKFVPFARYNNPTKRIVNELSTTYSEPARRQVPNRNDEYQALLRHVRVSERALEWDRLLSLHGALLVGFRVGEKPDGSRYPAIDIATPAAVRAIMHPNDDTEVIGWMIRCSHRTARKQINQPDWVVWTDHESFYLREDLSLIGDSYQEHGLGMCPWVPVTIMPPGPGFWPGNYGADLVAGHISIWFQSILSLKESKSATKQTIIQGDGTSMSRGQAADSEVPIELADGQNATTVDMSMDLEMFQKLEDHILYSLGHNHGLSPAIIEHQGVQSAEARELMRIPLKEIRRRRQIPLRIFEERLALVMAAVCANDLPEYAFDPVGWRIDFAETETPLDPRGEFDLFVAQRQAGLMSTKRWLVERRGMSPEDAEAFIAANVGDEVMRNLLMRPLQQVSGSMGASTPEQPADGSPTFESNRGESQDNTTTA